MQQLFAKIVEFFESCSITSQFQGEPSYVLKHVRNYMIPVGKM